MRNEPRTIFRVDKFLVPKEVSDEFLAQVKAVHQIFDDMEGCLQNLILRQTGGSGEFNIVTFVEWRDEHAFSQARHAVQARHHAAGFNPEETFSRMRIRADLANYEIIP